MTSPKYKRELDECKLELAEIYEQNDHLRQIVADQQLTITSLNNDKKMFKAKEHLLDYYRERFEYLCPTIERVRNPQSSDPKEAEIIHRYEEAVANQIPLEKEI